MYVVPQPSSQIGPIVSHYLESLFKPASVAVVGISNSVERGGNTIYRAAVNEAYSGHVYAVGRSGGTIDGQPIYPTISDLPEVPDLVFAAVGLKATPAAMIEAAEAGVKVGIVFTAGFAEMDEEGATVQREFVKRCNELGMRVVGPNCMGVLDFESGLHLTSIRDIQEGPVGLISQSGNIALTVFERAALYDIGFNSFVSFGNQADIPIIDYLEYMAENDRIEVILMYVESLQELTGQDFVSRAQKVARRKPIVAIKGGATQAGRRAAASHTSRLSSSEDVYDAAFWQAGIVQVKELDHLLAVTEAVLRCPPMKGRRVAIVGSGGGHSTIGTDCVERHRMTIPPFGDKLQNSFKEHLPPWAPIGNPVDMTGGFTEDLTLFARLMRYPLSSPDFDGGLSYGLYGEAFKTGLVDEGGLTWETAAPLLGDIQRQTDKPIVFYTPYANDNEPAFTASRKSGVPCYGSLSEAAAALAALAERGEFLNREAGEPVLVDRSPGGTGGGQEQVSLTEFESLKILGESGLEIVPQRLVRSEDLAVAAAQDLGYPVVLKAQLENVAHKSDIGGIRLGLDCDDDVRRAYGEIDDRLGDGDGTIRCTVSRQLSPEREILLGVRRDPAFGQVVVIGIGGVLTEVASRTTIVIPPVTERELAAALTQTPLAQYLGPWRGKGSVSMRQLHRCIDAVVQALGSEKGLESIDVNPLVEVHGRLVAVDAAVIRNRESRS